MQTRTDNSRKPTVAIVGGGIAGMGCAYFLRDQFDITLFDRNDHVGGHSRTVGIREDDREVPIDTGFMVFNKVTYPNLTRLFEELDVPIQPAPMSFSVQHRPTGLEYCGSSLNHLFAQRANLVRPAFWNLLRQINRFNREAPEALEEKSPYSELTLRQYVDARRYGDAFFNLYLVPMSSAVWSSPPKEMERFPAAALIRFFHNHGFLGLHTQHPWWTVRGGSRTYVRKMTDSFGDRIKLVRAVRGVTVTGSGSATVTTADGLRRSFDRVILACHADEALGLLENPDRDVVNALSPFRYQTNRATLHTDEAVMPENRRCWASWNYRIDASTEGNPHPSTIYWMNSLQNVSDRRNYFVSINDPGRVRPDAVLKTIDYEHPLFSLEAMQAQSRLPLLNAKTDSPLRFAGSYFRFGFHEDAFTSALELSRAMSGRGIWS